MNCRISWYFDSSDVGLSAQSRDLAQEVCERSWEKASTFTSMLKPHAWVLKTPKL